MLTEHRAADWDTVRMTYSRPHDVLEPAEQEIARVHAALADLVAAGILPHVEYDIEAFAAHRRAVAERFDIPWTAITPRMQRLLYAVNAIHRPARMIAAGVFCGNTFFSNAGAAVGPGACYRAEDLVGIEIQPDQAERAERNVRSLDPTGPARVVTADAVAFVRDYDEAIDLLYLDADGGPEGDKGIYYDILQAARPRLSDGALVLAHNSVNCADRLAHYLAWVRDSANATASVNLVLDIEGLEVTKL